MAKKADPRTLLASSSSTSPGVAPERLPYVSGAILQQAEAAGPEPSPAAAEPMPVGVWPPVDEYLDEPDEIERWERIDEEKKHASPATAGHGDPHFKLDSLVDAHLAEGYVGSVDLKTRVSKKHEYASDTCVRKAGIDPATKRRYLEELVFEVAYKRSKKETNQRARGFAKRGVRRQIGIFVKEKTVREWLRSKNGWGKPMDLRRSLRDSCLAVPLPLAALLDPALAKVAIARALEAKGDPVILEMKEKSEKLGRAESILAVLSTRGIVVSEKVRQRIRATTDLETLERWLRQAVSASSLDEVFDEID